MKLRRYLTTLACTLTLNAISPIAGAQAPTPPPSATDQPAAAPTEAGPTPPVAPSTPSTEKTEDARETKAIPVFSSPPGKLTNVVDSLQQELQRFNQPRLNIVFEPGVEGTAVPGIELYNVFGQDALLLVAAAADCAAKPIHGPESGKSGQQRIIGYRLQKENKPVDGGQFGMSGAMAGIMPGMGATAPAPGGDGMMAGGGLVAGAPSADAAAGRSVVGFGGMGGGLDAPTPVAIPGLPGAIPLPLTQPGPGASGRAGNEPTGELRVYALGMLNKVLPKDRVVETISALLHDEDAVRGGVQVKFHDNTNVLVVRGPAETHRLVTELIEALERNASAGAYKSDAPGTPPGPGAPGAPAPPLNSVPQKH
jgi:hypothetical protein